MDTFRQDLRYACRQLIRRPGFAAVWTLKFCDLLKASDYGVYADGISQEQDAPRFMQWVRARLEENLPYDQFAECILTATSRDGHSVEEWARDVQAINEGYAAPRTDLTLYSKRKTLDLYWQRRAAGAREGRGYIYFRRCALRAHEDPHPQWRTCCDRLSGRIARHPFRP